MNIITILVDIFIGVLSILVFFKINGHGGLVGRALMMIGYGIVIIGLSQTIETILVDLLHLNEKIIEIIIHLLLLAGMISIYTGFIKMFTKPE